MHLTVQVSFTSFEFSEDDPTPGLQTRGSPARSWVQNTTPLPPGQPPVSPQGLRQPTGAQEGAADRPEQREKGAHDPPGLLTPPH